MFYQGLADREQVSGWTIKILWILISCKGFWCTTEVQKRMETQFRIGKVWVGLYKRGFNSVHMSISFLPAVERNEPWSSCFAFDYELFPSCWKMLRRIRSNHLIASMYLLRTAIEIRRHYHVFPNIVWRNGNITEEYSVGDLCCPYRFSKGINKRKLMNNEEGWPNFGRIWTNTWWGQRSGRYRKWKRWDVRVKLFLLLPCHLKRSCE